MKFFLLITAALSLAIPSIAEAKHERGGGHGQGRAERRHDDRGPHGGRWRGPPDYGPGGPGRAKPGKAPKPFDSRPGRRMGLGRGQTMPPQFRGPRMEDYGRYRLRRPPPGYSYHLRGNRAYLVSDDTGMIFEVVPLGR